VNGKKHGGREKSEPEQAVRRRYPEVELRDGDEVKVGRTVMKISIEDAPQHAEASEQAREELARNIFELNRKDEKDAHAFIEQRIGKYVIERELGRGGFGAVYLVRESPNSRPLALKVMLSRIALDEVAVKKFLREIRSVSGLRHPKIVEVVDAGENQGLFYFVMEFCEGGSLDQFIGRHGGKLSLKQAMPIMLDTLEGLAHAHTAGFVHRDLKPQNILLQRAGSGFVAKISDFGLAKNFEQAGFSGLTMTGHFAGTPYFMPREQVINFRHVKPVSDVWSIGATFYHMLTGDFPRDFKADRDPIEAVLNDEVISIRKRDRAVPAPVAQVIDRAISNKTKERYQTASEMFEALKKALSC
jgi:serine/threonine protein kinase